MQPETIRRFDESLWTLIPRAIVVMLFLGGQSWMAYLIWRRLHALGPNPAATLMAIFLLLNVLISAWLSYYYRSPAMTVAAVGWLIVSFSSLLFAIGFGATTLLSMAVALQAVLLFLGLRYGRIAGVDCEPARPLER